MKKAFILLIALIAGGMLAHAQKFAFVDSEYILNNIPAYESAKAQLDELSTNWQTEVEDKFKEVEDMYKKFQAENVLLTDEQKTKRENDIITKEKEAKDLKISYFGKEGELFKKRQELIKPIQDEIFNTVKAIAEEGNFAIIFDVAGGGMTFLYTDPKYDKSDEVLQRLGYKN